MNRIMNGKTLAIWLCFLAVGFFCLAGGAVFAADDFNAGGGDKPADAKAEKGDKPAEGGDKPAGAGDKPAEAGDKPAEGGDKPAEAGDKPAEAGDKPAEAGDKTAEGGDKPVEAGNDLSASGLKAGADEADQVENLVEKFPFKLEKDLKDPFKPIVEKKVAALPQVAAPKPMLAKNAGSNAAPPPPPPPPLKMMVTGVCGNDADRLAMVMFENELITIKKDQEVKGKFKVVDILSDKVVVYSNKEQMRRTFPIGGGKE